MYVAVSFQQSACWTLDNAKKIPPLERERWDCLKLALWNFDLFGKDAGLSVGSDAHGAEGAGFLNLQRVRVKGR